MFDMKGGLGGMLQQAQKMQEEIKRLQEEAGKKTVEASSGGGMVKVVANGKMQILSVTIEEEALKLNDKEMLQDLVLGAVNQALKAAQDMMAQEMGKFTSALGPLGSMLKGM